MNRRKWTITAAVAFVVIAIVALVATTSGSAKFRCEVCMNFNGGTACRSGAASTKLEAQRIATDLACSDLGAGGFSKCPNLEPARVTWK